MKIQNDYVTARMRLEAPHHQATDKLTGPELAIAMVAMVIALGILIIWR